MSLPRTLLGLTQGLLVLLALAVFPANAGSQQPATEARAEAVYNNAVVIGGLHEREADDLQTAVAALIFDQTGDDDPRATAGSVQVTTHVPRDSRTSDLCGLDGVTPLHFARSTPPTGPPHA